MLLLITLILCFCNFSLIQSTSFLELPLKLQSGNLIIHASLTDKTTGQVWQIEEKISSKDDRVQGKVDVTEFKTHQVVNVFYSFKPPYDTGRRLVMQNNNCDVYLFKSNWDKQFPGLPDNKTLINKILLIGPSFFYRLVDSNWVSGPDEVVRGALMHSATFVLGQKLKVTAYYKSPDDVKIGVTQPNRLVLTGFDPNAEVEGDIGETFIMDIYLLSKTYQELSETVQPTPGIGCPSYLQNNIDLPTLSIDRIHFIAKDTINQTRTSLKEVHADETKQTLRLTEQHFGFSYNYLFDYNLGLEYTLSTTIRDCSLYPIDSTSLGVGTNGKLELTSLLWLQGSFQYLGQVIFEHRSGFKARVWESVETDKVIESGKYDKVVTTAYFTPSVTSVEGTFSGYLMVAATRNAYKKDATDNFVLIESIYRDFYDFDVDLPEAEYEEAFALGECYADPTKRLTLTMHITCVSAKQSNCIKKGEEMTYSLREGLLDRIDKTYGLSPLRIVQVEFIFTKDRIEADVTFVDTPSIEESFRADYQYVKVNFINKYHDIEAKSAEECLKYLSTYNTPGSAVVYCKEDKLCISTNDPDSIKPAKTSADGSYCAVYNIPLKNLHRVGQEKTLKEIHDHLLDSIINDRFTLKDNISGDTYTYEMIDVVASNKRAEEEKRQLFEFLNSGVKLTVNGLDTIEVTDIKQFSDCYRACSKSEDIFCETFSFCETKDTFTCLVSTLTEKEVEKNLTSDVSCMTYAKKHILDYTERLNEAYKVISSVTTDQWLDECANECAASPDCYSFEFCDGRCTFGGYYMESNAKYSPECAIYTPKLSQNYQLTGSKVITEVLHTELDLDLDQCATFCFDYEGGDGETCRSFNYCPKSKSTASCQLTKYSVSSVNNLIIQSSDNCHNYELITKGKQNENPIGEMGKISHSTGAGAAFGLIMLFLVIGLIVGFVGPYLVMKIKSLPMLRRSSDDFSWSKHVDKTEDDHDEIQI